jgi:hypothetical protein
LPTKVSARKSQSSITFSIGLSTVISLNMTPTPIWQRD